MPVSSSSATSGGVISLQRIKRELAVIEIQGTAPLIVHNWSVKAKQIMLGLQQGKKTPKTPKDPENDFQTSMYRTQDGGHGFPVTAFKQATVRGGGRAFGKSVRQTELRQTLLFMADDVDIVGGLQVVRLEIDEEPVMREDMVRVGMGKADLRYRAMYPKWGAQLRITYLPSLIDLASVIALLDAGGDNGIGEWRPEKDGLFGTYAVVGGEAVSA